MKVKQHTWENVCSKPVSARTVRISKLRVYKLIKLNYNSMYIPCEETLCLWININNLHFFELIRQVILSQLCLAWLHVLTPTITTKSGTGFPSFLSCPLHPDRAFASNLPLAFDGTKANLIRQGPLFKQLPEQNMYSKRSHGHHQSLFSSKSRGRKIIQMVMLEVFSLLWTYPGMDFRSNEC